MYYTMSLLKVYHTCLSARSLLSHIRINDAHAARDGPAYGTSLNYQVGLHVHHDDHKLKRWISSIIMKMLKLTVP